LEKSTDGFEIEKIEILHPEDNATAKNKEVIPETEYSTTEVQYVYPHIDPFLNVFYLLLRDLTESDVKNLLKKSGAVHVHKHDVSFCENNQILCLFAVIIGYIRRI